MATSHPLVRVGKVTFGKGLFARRAIQAGEHLGVVAGKIIDDPEYTSAYCIDLGNNVSLEPRAPFRYLNHCCEPNCALMHVTEEYEDGSEGPGEIHVDAIRDIEEGEELRIDYAWSADGAIKCLCGSKKCRGWVVAEEELPKLAKRSRRKSVQAPSVARRTGKSKS